MAKKSVIANAKLKIECLDKYRSLRDEYKNQRCNTESTDQIYYFNKCIQKMPRNSSSVRIRNRCWKTGKPRGFLRFFGLCRNVTRELALDCFLPGVIKSSW
jgi:small subunit ribosomal protein S14